MADPTLKKTSVRINYGTSDGYRMEFGAKGGTGSKNLVSGEEVPPERALLAGLEEMSRLLSLFGFEQEAQRAFEEPRRAVAEWRANRNWTGPTYTTTPSESIAGIAQRELRDEKRWSEIADLNAERFPGMTGADYYPVGTVLRMPPLPQTESRKDADA